VGTGKVRPVLAISNALRSVPASRIEHSASTTLGDETRSRARSVAAQQQFFARLIIHGPAGSAAADVKVLCLPPLKPNDDFILWSLLSLTLRHSDNHALTETPYWYSSNRMVRRPAVSTSCVTRSERLSQLVYRNTGFLHPLSQT